jgi:SNF2 family DNA or RNA helicase
MTSAYVADISKSVLEPLCERSAAMLEPVSLSVNDRLSVEMSEDGKSFILQPYAVLHGQQVQASWAARSHWLTRIPERKDIGHNRHECAATDTTALIINAVWGFDRIDFGPRACETLVYLMSRFMAQTISAKQRALYKIRGESPEMPDWYHDHPDHPLSNYQRLAVIGSYKQEGSALFMDPGTGKTACVIRRICCEALALRQEQQAAGVEHPRMYRALIVCPKNVRFNWHAEIHKFSTVPGKATVLRGGKQDRMMQTVEALVDDGSSLFTAIICSYETAIRGHETFRTLAGGTTEIFDLGVCDESHYIKSPYNKRLFEFIGQDTGKNRILGMRDLFRQRMNLTGTPVTNSLLDLWGQFEWLGEGLSGFNAWRQFRKFYAAFDDKTAKADDHDTDEAPAAPVDTTTDISKYSNIPLLQERLSRLAFMITKKEALPELMAQCPKTYDAIEVQMAPEQREAYMQLQNQLALEIEAGLESRTMTPQNVLVQLLRLAQITSGYAVFDPELDDQGVPVPRKSSDVHYFSPNPKLEALVAELRACGPESKQIVWACFIPDVNAISQRLVDEGIDHVIFTGQTNDHDRAEAERRFNQDPVCRVFLGNPAAGGVGLNLRGYDPALVEQGQDHGMNCDRVFYYSQGWSLVHRAQSEDRAHRRGTRVPVRYTDLVVPGTIDEEIRMRVVEKGLSATQLQDVREIMHRLLAFAPTRDDE